MKTNHIPQLGAATALVQLLQENPDLPEAGWSIGSVIAELRGFVHTDSMADLVAYQDVIGGRVQAATCFQASDGMRRRHILTSVWRDVQVEVVVALPENTAAVAA